MVSDQEIASCVESLLRQPPSVSGVTAPGGTVVNVAGVVRQVEAKLGLDLSDKAGFIRDQIDRLLGPPRNPNPPPSNPKDHSFLFHLHAQHPHSQMHPQLQMGPGMGAATGVASPFAQLPHPHELAFRYPPPMAFVAQQQQQHHHHHQQMQQQQQAVAVAQRVEAPVAVRTVASGAPVKESAPTGAKRRGGPGGLSKVCGVSPELQAIVGEPTMARTQIVKQLWAYIRKHNLQDPNNKRKIMCNDELRLVFETDCTDMFKMNKLLAKHIIPLGPPKESGSDSKRAKIAPSEVVSETESDGGQYPVSISDALETFFGTGEREMLQSEALKRVWDYIKVNQLEDPMNAMVILCDAKLQQLFGCESLSALGVSEMLSRHLFKQS